MSANERLERQLRQDKAKRDSVQDRWGALAVKNVSLFTIARTLFGKAEAVRLYPEGDEG